MRIAIKGTGMRLTPAIHRYAEEKLGSLVRFVALWDKEGSVGLMVDIARSTRHHKKGEVFHVDADMVVHGKVLRAEDDDEDVYLAIHRVKDTLQREIKTMKEKTRVRGAKLEQ